MTITRNNDGPKPIPCWTPLRGRAHQTACRSSNYLCVCLLVVSVLMKTLSLYMGCGWYVEYMRFFSLLQVKDKLATIYPFIYITNRYLPGFWLEMLASGTASLEKGDLGYCFFFSIIQELLNF